MVFAPARTMGTCNRGRAGARAQEGRGRPGARPEWRRAGTETVSCPVSACVRNRVCGAPSNPDPIWHPIWYPIWCPIFLSSKNERNLPGHKIGSQIGSRIGSGARRPARGGPPHPLAFVSTLAVTDPSAWKILQSIFDHRGIKLRICPIRAAKAPVAPAAKLSSSGGST